MTRRCRRLCQAAVILSLTILFPLSFARRRVRRAGRKRRLHDVSASRESSSPSTPKWSS